VYRSTMRFYFCFSHRFPVIIFVVLCNFLVALYGYSNPGFVPLWICYFDHYLL
jgi:hypothetical protein